MFTRSLKNHFLWERNQRPRNKTIDLQSLIPEPKIHPTTTKRYVKRTEEIDQQIILCDKLLNKRDRPLFTKRLPSVKRSNRLTLNALGSINSKRSKCKYSSAQNSPRGSFLEDTFSIAQFSQASTALNTPQLSPTHIKISKTGNRLFSNPKIITSSLKKFTLDEQTS